MLHYFASVSAARGGTVDQRGSAGDGGVGAQAEFGAFAIGTEPPVDSPITPTVEAAGVRAPIGACPVPGVEGTVHLYYYFFSFSSSSSFFSLSFFSFSFFSFFSFASFLRSVSTSTISSSAELLTMTWTHTVWYPASASLTR